MWRSKGSRGIMALSGGLVALGGLTWWGTPSLEGLERRRRQVFGNYENRLRAHASPEKVFEYFASVPASEVLGNDARRNEMLMTPEDFVRSIVGFASEDDDRAVGSANFQFSLKANRSVPNQVLAEYRDTSAEIIRQSDRAMKKEEGAEEALQALHKRLRCLRNRYLIPFHVQTEILNQLGTTRNELFKSSPFVQLVDQDGDGFISFEEYLFFTSMLGLPREHLDLLFRLIDSSGNGFLDREEFTCALKWICKQGRQASRSVFAGKRLSERSQFIVGKLFGCKAEITLDDLSGFLEQLHANVAELEFETFDTDDSGTLSPSQFLFYIAAAHASDKLRDKVIRKAYELKEQDSKSISLAEFQQFSRSLVYLERIKMAMELVQTSEEDGQGGLELNAFLSCVKAVSPDEAHVMPPKIATLLFHTLDVNGDGRLAISEILGLISQRSNVL